VWTGVIEQYFREREALRGVVLVLDVRHAPTDLDVQFVTWLGELGADRPPVLWLLNKADKLTQSERMKARNAFCEQTTGIVGPDDVIVLFSAHSGLGMKECAAVFTEWLTPFPEDEPDASAAAGADLPAVG
jgi:GTP-binding protein